MRYAICIQWKAAILTLFFSLIVFPVNAGVPVPFDIVITDGKIIDGSGSPWYSGDIGIREGKIAAIGNLTAAPRKRTIDAHGFVVAPGFIDMLGQSELTILVDPRLPSKIYQRITTEITGEGESIAPLNEAILRTDRGTLDQLHVQADWRTFRQYFARLEKQGIGINVAHYVVAKIDGARAEGIDIAADTYAYTAWGNGLYAFIPPWAHEGGKAKLLERLKDPSARARIRKDLLTPSDDWENEWQQISGPESVLITSVQNPKLLPLPGKTLAEVAKLWSEDPMDTIFDILVQDDASTGIAAFGMSEPDVVLALQQPWVRLTMTPPAFHPK